MGEHMDKAKGKTKQAAGDLTGDDEMKNEGKVDETSGKAKGAIDSAKDKAGDAVDSVKDKFN